MLPPRDNGELCEVPAGAGVAARVLVLLLQLLVDLRVLLDDQLRGLQLHFQDRRVGQDRCGKKCK